MSLPPDRVFVVARNPEADSKLPFLLWLPLDPGLVLKARDTWPRANRIYCQPSNRAGPMTPRSSRRLAFPP